MNMIRNHWRTGGMPGDFGWHCTCGWSPDDTTFSGLAKVNSHAEQAHAAEVAEAKAAFEQASSKTLPLESPEAKPAARAQIKKIKSRRVLKTVAACRSERVVYKGSNGTHDRGVFRLTRIFNDGVIGLGDVIVSLDNGQKTVVPVSESAITDERLLELVNEDHDQTYVPLPEKYRKVY